MFSLVFATGKDTHTMYIYDKMKGMTSITPLDNQWFVCIVSSTECTIVIIHSIECVEKFAHSIERLPFYRLACILRIPRLRNAFYRMCKFLD